MDSIDYKTLAILYLLLNGFMKMSDELRLDIIPHTYLSGREQKRIITYFDILSSSPQNKWNTKDPYLIYSVLSYLIHKAVMNSDLLYQTMDGLDKIMKKETAEKLITYEKYLLYRRTNFKLRRLCKKLCDDGDYVMDFTNFPEEIQITYGVK